MNDLITNIISSPLAVSASYGICGGLIRAFVDSIKFAVIKKKTQTIEKRGVLFYFLSVILIGAFMGIVLDYGWALSSLGGYAGQDILDVLYSSMKKIKVHS
jgi:hypothetical protein